MSLSPSVGLGCGHKFCRNCALEAAGFGRAIGAFHNIISHVPPRVGCPQCRQQGVFRNAVALREVGKLIQTRCGSGRGVLVAQVGEQEGKGRLVAGLGEQEGQGRLVAGVKGQEARTSCMWYVHSLWRLAS